METGIIRIEMMDGSSWNVHYQNSTQKRNILCWYDKNKLKVRAIDFPANGIHTTKQFLTMHN